MLCCGLATSLSCSYRISLWFYLGLPWCPPLTYGPGQPRSCGMKPVRHSTHESETPFVLWKGPEGCVCLFRTLSHDMGCFSCSCSSSWNLRRRLFSRPHHAAYGLILSYLMISHSKLDHGCQCEALSLTKVYPHGSFIMC